MSTNNINIINEGVQLISNDEFDNLEKHNSYQIEDTLVYNNMFYINVSFKGASKDHYFKLYISKIKESPQLFLQHKNNDDNGNHTFDKTLSFDLTPFLEKNQKFKLFSLPIELIFKEYWS